MVLLRKLQLSWDNGPVPLSLSPCPCPPVPVKPLSPSLMVRFTVTSTKDIDILVYICHESINTCLAAVPKKPPKNSKNLKSHTIYRVSNRIKYSIWHIPSRQRYFFSVFPWHHPFCHYINLAYNFRWC